MMKKTILLGVLAFFAINVITIQTALQVTFPGQDLADTFPDAAQRLFQGQSDNAGNFLPQRNPVAEIFTAVQEGNTVSRRIKTSVPASILSEIAETGIIGKTSQDIFSSSVRQSNIQAGRCLPRGLRRESSDGVFFINCEISLYHRSLSSGRPSRDSIMHIPFINSGEALIISSGSIA